MKRRKNGDEQLRKLQRKARETGDDTDIEAYWRAALKRRILPEPNYIEGEETYWKLKWLELHLWSDGTNYVVRYNADEIGHTAYSGLSKEWALDEVRQHLLWFLDLPEGRWGKNPDDALRAAERKAFETKAPQDRVNYWRIALRAGVLPKPTSWAGKDPVEDRWWV